MLVLLLNPVYSHTEKSFYRQFSMNNKIKIIRINTGFVSLSLRPLEANKTGFNFFILIWKNAIFVLLLDISFATVVCNRPCYLLFLRTDNIFLRKVHCKIFLHKLKDLLQFLFIACFGSKSYVKVEYQQDICLSVCWTDMTFLFVGALHRSQ